MEDLLLEENPDKEKKTGKKEELYAAIKEKIILSLNGETTSEDRTYLRENVLDRFFRTYISQIKDQETKEKILRRRPGNIDVEKIALSPTSIGVILYQLKRMRKFLIYHNIDSKFDLGKKLREEISGRTDFKKKKKEEKKESFFKNLFKKEEKGERVDKFDNTAGILGDLKQSVRKAPKGDISKEHKEIRNSGAEKLQTLLYETNYFGLYKNNFSSSNEAYLVLERAITKIEDLFLNNTIHIVDVNNPKTWKL